MSTQMVRKKGISSDFLKIVALVTMLIDHIGAVLIEQFLFDIWYTKDTFQEWYYNLYLIFRLIGRTAFPIYCYLLTEGFKYTSNRVKYGFRLFIFCIISELPFDYAVSGKWTLGDQNVFFTLFIGYLAIFGIDKIRQKDFSQFFKVTAGILITAAAAISANLLHTDYSAGGVILIICFYLFGQNYRAFTLLAFLLVHSFTYRQYSMASQFILQSFCFPAFILIGECNHVRHLKMKYLFYIFYPAHFILLYVTGMLLQRFML